MHAIRDCEVARQLWACFVPSDMFMEFNSLGVRDWIVWLIKRGRKMGLHKRWAEKILIASWL